MIAFYYIVGLVIYTLSAMMSYSNKAQSAKWYFPVGVGMAMLANFLWLHIAKISVGHETFVRGLVWDSMIVMCYVLVPIILYGIRLTGFTALGAALIVAGMFLTKIN